MSNTPKHWTKATPADIYPPEYLAAIAAKNAELEVKAAAHAAAVRQEQKDLIKEAIIEALRETAHLFQPLTFPNSSVR